MQCGALQGPDRRYGIGLADPPRRAAESPGIATFLAAFPPFDALPADDLGEIARRVETRSYADGANILVEDGPPSSHLYVVATGSVGLVHQGELVDVLGPGECFGHPSLLSGMAPAFTVRSQHGTSCYLIRAREALAVLGRPAGAGYVATSLRERLTRTGQVVHALPELATMRVDELMTDPPIFCAPDDSIRSAARVMTENHRSAILVSGGGALEIVTDATLRARVVAGDVSADDPVSRIALPASTVSPAQLAVEATIDMLDSGADHLVVVDPARGPIAVLSATDLAIAETHSPFALRHGILRATTEDELVAAASKLPRLFLALHGAALAPADIGRVLTLQVEALTSRLIDLALERHGPAPVAWAWLALGSAARREFTLASDQENALAYADSEDVDRVDAWFGRFAADVNRGLARCRWPPDANQVLAESSLWRMSAASWVRVFEDCLVSPDRSHLIRANVAFDFRQIGGGLSITQPLVAVLRRAKEHPDFLRQIARSATELKPPLGFRGSLAVHEIDLKRRGVIPITNIARYHALANGITVSGTDERLVSAQELGALDDETATELREASVVIARTRYDHHAAQIQTGLAPDSVIEPGDLPPLARAHLRDAFLAVSRAQKRLAVHRPLGI
ncbi:MAG: putative nucleotidyltransferase substrate binding domain-containing protein [Gaiellales bacterium]